MPRHHCILNILIMGVIYFRHEREKHPDYRMEQMAPESEEGDEETPKEEDLKNNYHTARLTFGLIILLLTDAVKEGDTRRLHQDSTTVSLYIWKDQIFICCAFIFG